MNSFLHVARSYAGRYRFWIFPALYVLLPLMMKPDSFAGPAGRAAAAILLVYSALLAGLLCGLVALHLRRQLSGPAVYLVPRFAEIQLTFGAVIAILVCVVYPASIAAIFGLSVVQAVGVHALAAVLMAAVLLWPKSFLGLLLFPAVLVVWETYQLPAAAFWTQLFEGESGPAGVMFVAALLAYPLAAFAYLRTCDRTTEYCDDLMVDRPPESPSRLKEWLLRFRDAAIEWRIGCRASLAQCVRRWQTPCLVSWWEVGALVCLLSALIASVTYSAGASGGMAIATLAGGVALFLPLGSWRFRCRALSYEIMRPVSRPRFVRQFMTAMLGDFLRWTIVATLIFGSAFAASAWFEPQAGIGMPWKPLSMLWAVAALLYGIAALTVRLRYWLPWLLALFVASSTGVGMLTSVLQNLGLQTRLVYPTFVALFVLLGAVFVAVTYRRWLMMEIT
ncbi:MAG: hypothetical protein DWQ37_23540 [Planctomycetota bacterium]|nr:MAG: hypothetical protein DWQ37_23540 [Planctomycetota bacterium]